MTPDPFPTQSPPHAVFTDNVIPHMLAWRRQAAPCALVTLVNVEGSSPRPVGSQMAVNADGSTQGYISSGCAHAAIVAEAIEAINRGVNRTVRYGAGSKYMDVVLPCGSGIDVYFDATIAEDTLAELDGAIAARRHVAMAIDLDGNNPSQIASRIPSNHSTPDRPFQRQYRPQRRIVIAGRGIDVDCLARLAHGLEWNVIAVSPEEATLARLAPYANGLQHLAQADDFDASIVDADTAVVLVLHDHDWEPTLLAKCVGRSAFYVGALGSRRTHAQRRELLSMLGCPPAFIDAIRSPVGLDIGARNPAEIAIAIVAEILALAPRVAD